MTIVATVFLPWPPSSAKMARRTITTVTRAAEADTASTVIAAGDPVFMVSSRREGSIQAMDARGLVRWASRCRRLLADWARSPATC